MRSSVGVVGLDLEINTKQFSRTLKGLAGVFTGALVADSMLDFVKESMSLGSNLQELQNVTTVVFGDMTKSVDDFCKSALDSFGLSELSAKRFTATIGAMFKTAGVTGEKLKIMSESVAALSGDMASFYDIDAGEAFYKLMAGISGEVEPLRRLAGIDLRQANLQDWLESTRGIKTSFEALDAHSQMLVRYNYLLSVTSAQQGDFARTSMSWANQTRILGEQFKNFQIIMGQGFINILTPVIHWLNAIIQKLIVAAQYFKAFTELIWGSSQISADASNNAVGMADSMDQVGDSAKKASKKVKNSLAPFDQLNLLTQSTANAAKEAADAAVGQIGELGGSVDLSKMTPPPMPIVLDIEALKAMKRSILDALGPLGNISFQPLIDALSKLMKAFEPFTTTAFQGLQWLYSSVLVPLATWTIEGVLPGFLNLLAGVFTVLNPLLVAFQPLAEFLWNSFLQPIALWVGGTIVATLNELGNVLTVIGNWMSDNISTVSGITKVLVAFFAAWKVIELMSFIQASGGVLAVLAKLRTAFLALTVAKLAEKAETIALHLLYAKDFVVSIAKGTAAIVVQIGHWIALTAAQVASKVAMIAGTVAQGAMTAAMIAWNAACGIGTAVTTAFNAALAVLTSPITLVVAAIAALVAGIVLLVKNWDTVKEVAANVWNNIKSVWSNVAAWFENNVTNPIKNSFTTVCNAIKTVWNAMLKGITSMIGSFVNPLIDGINLLIKGLNKIKFEIPDWVPKVGGKGFGINIPLIPRLAQGGLVSQPTLAMVGDNKNASVDPEVIAPLSKLQGMLDSGNGEVVALLRLILEALRSGDREAILKVEESTFGRVAIRAINTVQRQAGVTLLNV